MSKMNPVVHFEMPAKPMEIPGIGSYASFLDTEGNRVSVLQPAI